MEKLGERLRELRHEKELSAMALGKIIHVTDTTIINWENSKRSMSIYNLVRLAKFFEVSTDYLLGLVDGY